MGNNVTGKIVTRKKHGTGNKRFRDVERTLCEKSERKKNVIGNKVTGKIVQLIVISIPNLVKLRSANLYWQAFAAEIGR